MKMLRLGSKGFHNKTRGGNGFFSPLHHLHLPFPSSVYFLPDVCVNISWGGVPTVLVKAPGFSLKSLMASLPPLLISHPVFFIC